ncbi:MAG TPA: response regulator [Nitrospiraceae bacterium]|nr:response regulator [Nitrospiraceae bacterium]
MERSRILILDDDAALLEALSGTLSLWFSDITVDTCASVELALTRIAWVDYDVIICEGRLPGMDGATLISQMKKVRPMTPIIVLTGHGAPCLARQAFEAGAYDFLFKPIDRHVLLLSVIRAIEAHRFRSRFAPEAHRWLSESSRYRLHPHV